MIENITDSDYRPLPQEKRGEKMDQSELDEVLHKHYLWIRGEDGGEEANLSGARLFGTDLSREDLSYSILFEADLRNSFLTGTNLSCALMVRADLSDAHLGGTIGNMSEIKSMQIEEYCVTYTADRLQIGWKNHAIKDWWGFSDEAIGAMGHVALDWWKKWKPVLQQIIEMSPATPTGHEENSEDAA